MARSGELIEGRDLCVELCVLPKNFDFGLVDTDGNTGQPNHKVSPRRYEKQIITAAEFAEKIGKKMEDMPPDMPRDAKVDFGEFLTVQMAPTLFTTFSLSKELAIEESEIAERIRLLGIKPDGESEGDDAYHLTNVLPWVLWKLYSANMLAEAMDVDRQSMNRKLKNIKPVATKDLGNREAKYYWLNQILPSQI